MKTRTLFFIAVLIAALALGAGLILAQDNGGIAKELFGFGRHGATGRDFHGFGHGAMGRGMMERGSGMLGYRRRPARARHGGHRP